MAKKGPTPEEIRLAEAMQLMESWNAVRQYMQYAISTGELTQEHEQQFLRVRTEVSKLQRSVSQKLPEGVVLLIKEMGELLRRIYSLEDIRNQPEADRSVLIESWHKCRISVVEVVGALQYIAQGYDYDPSTRPESGATSVSSVKGGKAKKAGKSNKMIIVIVVVLILAVIGWFMFG